MTTKSTPAEIAQRSLDAAQKRVDKAEQDISKAEQTLAEAKAELSVAVVMRDFRKGHPALKSTAPSGGIPFPIVTGLGSAS